MSEDVDNDPEKIAAEAYEHFQAENDLLHVEHDIVLQGGPAEVDGLHFLIADGVDTLQVEVAGSYLNYLRSARLDNTFVYHPKGK